MVFEARDIIEEMAGCSTFESTDFRDTEVPGGGFLGIGDHVN